MISRENMVCNVCILFCTISIEIICNGINLCLYVLITPIICPNHSHHCPHHTHHLSLSLPSFVLITPIICPHHSHHLSSSHPSFVLITPIICPHHTHHLSTSHPSFVHIIPIICLHDTLIINIYTVSTKDYIINE